MKYCIHYLIYALGMTNVNAAFMAPNNQNTAFSTNSIVTRNIQSPSLSSPLSSRVAPGPALTTLASTQQNEEQEQEFKLRTKQLCNERNLKLQKVKNARDLASVKHCPIQPGRIIRTGRVSDATKQDLTLLNDQIGVKTLVDLRSYTELKDDLTLDRKEVFGDFVDLIWDEKKDLVRVLNKGRSRVEKKKNIAGHVKTLVGGAKKGIDVATHFRNETVSSSSTTSSAVDEVDDLLKVLTSAAELAESSDSCNDCDAPAKPIIHDENIDEHEELSEGGKVTSKDRFSKTYRNRKDLYKDKSRCDTKERHFVSIMNEMKYVKGTLSKVRKRDLAKALIKSPGAIVSKRVRSSCKDVFLDRINEGGLHMLNELLLKQGAPGIKYVLDLCKDRSRHPIAFYCTAGKDRTGMIAAIMLAAAGVPDEDIVEDYSLSANVYAEMNDHKAMVGALSQRNLDAKTFLGAPPEVMRDTLINIRSAYGSMEGYLDYIGFTEDDRKQLRAALIDN